MSRYYDETEREFEMMQQINGPQRGRRSQHHSRSNNRPSSGGANRSGRVAETEMGPGGADYPSSAPSSPHPIKTAGNHDAHALESGFFNKYAVADDQVDVRTNKSDPADQNNKSVNIRVFLSINSRHD